MRRATSGGWWGWWGWWWCWCGGQSPHQPAALPALRRSRDLGCSEGRAPRRCGGENGQGDTASGAPTAPWPLLRRAMVAQLLRWGGPEVGEGVGVGEAKRLAVGRLPVGSDHPPFAAARPVVHQRLCPPHRQEAVAAGVSVSAQWHCSGGCGGSGGGCFRCEQLARLEELGAGTGNRQQDQLGDQGEDRDQILREVRANGVGAAGGQPGTDKGGGRRPHFVRRLYLC